VGFVWDLVSTWKWTNNQLYTLCCEKACSI